MIYDSEPQKAFILEAVKKYPTNYETALNLANSFGMDIQNGQVIDPKEQAKAFPAPTPGAPAGDPKTNGNRKARRAAAKTETPPN